MNRAKVILLATTEEQIAAGDRDIIVPSGVKLPQGPVVCFAGFSYNVPDDVVGMVYDIRLEDGRIVGDLELDDKFEREVKRGEKMFTEPKMGIATVVNEHRQVMFASATEFVSVGLLSSEAAMPSQR